MYASVSVLGLGQLGPSFGFSGPWKAIGEFGWLVFVPGGPNVQTTTKLQEKPIQLTESKRNMEFENWEKVENRALRAVIGIQVWRSPALLHGIKNYNENKQKVNKQKKKKKGRQVSFPTTIPILVMFLNFNPKSCLLRDSKSGQTFRWLSNICDLISLPKTFLKCNRISLFIQSQFLSQISIIC